MKDQETVQRFTVLRSASANASTRIPKKDFANTGIGRAWQVVGFARLPLTLQIPGNPVLSCAHATSVNSFLEQKLRLPAAPRISLQLYACPPFR